MALLGFPQSLVEAEGLTLDWGWASLGAKIWGGLVRAGDTPGFRGSAGGGRRWQEEDCLLPSGAWRWSPKY